MPHPSFPARTESKVPGSRSTNIALIILWWINTLAHIFLCMPLKSKQMPVQVANPDLPCILLDCRFHAPLEWFPKIWHQSDYHIALFEYELFLSFVKSIKLFYWTNKSQTNRARSIQNMTMRLPICRYCIICNQWGIIGIKYWTTSNSSGIYPTIKF